MPGKKQRAARSSSSEINASNHWSRRPWILVENDPDMRVALAIYCDTGGCVLILVEQIELLTEGDRQIANYVITLHNATLKGGTT